jgi:poly(3-hydroxybutyrate) depolymerase
MTRLWLALLVAVPALAAEPLPALRAQKQGVTVSGLSAGGYMAVQFHVAHSSTVSGAAAIAAGPYYCAQGSLWTAQYNCMAPGAWTPVPAAAWLKAVADTSAQAGRIDAPKNLSGALVWLFSGTRDRTVVPEVTRELERFYALYGAKVVLVGDRPAGHAMPVTDAPAACGETQPPYLNDCDYDAAGELLRHLLGKLELAAPTPSGRLLQFAQGEAPSMADAGFVYVPKVCDAGGCRVHVAFHGCRQNAAAVGEAFVRDAGYNRWADTNRLIVLYPQTVARWWPFNPRACWDWWGYSGSGYATRDGAQIRAVKAMLDRLAE